MPRRSPLAIPLTVALSLAVAGCGGGESAEQARVDGVSPQARTAAQRTARFELVEVEHEGAVEFRNECAGAVDIDRRRYRLVCTPGAGDGLGFETVRVGGVEYTRWIDHSDSTNLGEGWRSASIDADDDARMTFDPVSLRARLRSASRDIEPVGRDRVRGVATDHVRLLVERRETDPTVDAGASDLIWIDMWVDGDGLLRRLRIERGPGAASTLEFFDFGVALEIEPPVDEVIAVGETEPPRCASVASPLTEATVTSVLAQHGIGLHRDGEGCYSEEDAAELMNLRFDADASDVERDAVRRREGVVWCSLRARPEPNAATTVERDGAAEEVSFTLANLVCTIFPEGEASTKQIRRLERAFAALAHSLD